MALAPPGTASPALPTPAAGGRVAGARTRYAADGGTTASPARIVVMLYERLAKDLDDAARALRDRNRAGAHDALVHAQEIVDALDMSLDVGRWDGGPSLRSVYAHLLEEMIAANVHQDLARVEACRRIVEPLLDAWTTAWRATAGSAADAAPVAGSIIGDEIGVGS